MKELLIGCGKKREKLLRLGNNSSWNNLITLDINPDHNPDVLWDLTKTPYPFNNNEFDEIHAYEVLEHTGAQGDYKFFFSQFSEFYRILKPNGMLFASCPSYKSPWAWGDPSHTRVIQSEQLIFLDQTEYTKQVGVTPMSDFRYIYDSDFTIKYLNENNDFIHFAIQAIKPSRLKM